MAHRVHSPFYFGAELKPSRILNATDPCKPRTPHTPPFRPESLHVHEGILQISLGKPLNVVTG